MRTPTINTPFYVPTDFHSQTDDIDRYLRNEFNRIAAAIGILATGHVEFTDVAPTKPREGDVRGALGVGWNPGSGKGIYAYYSGSWKFLG